jgi:holliday junction DNA helicase RuvA
VIATLNGKVAEKLAEQVVIDVAGVGYGVYVTVEDYGKLKIGGQAKVYVYEHIRETSHDLFGFVTQDNKVLFEQLLNVNGIGPKMALNMLSIGNSAEVRTAIAGGDVKFIQSANGVGKKVAERVVIELKDKVGLASGDVDGLFVGTQSAQKDEAVQALISLGFTAADALTALASVPADLPTEKRVKEALKVKV